MDKEKVDVKNNNSEIDPRVKSACIQNMVISIITIIFVAIIFILGIIQLVGIAV